jgi:hypothetical protein
LVRNDEIRKQRKDKNASHPPVQRSVDDHSGSEYGRNGKGRSVAAKCDRINGQRHYHRRHAEYQQDFGNIRSNYIANRNARKATECRL